MNLPFYTVGHSTRTLEAFADLLGGAGVALVADIRTIPRSRTNPQYNQATLARDLEPLGLAYEALPELGGLRGRSTTVPAEVNGMWENASFHNYADYALSAEFRAGLERLVRLGRVRRTAVMCSEAVWWRCHRRIVADHLLARGERVLHLMGKDRVEPARLTAGARIGADGAVVYPGAGGAT
jgi:uncharacterized protein (DUF488 family)